MYQHLLLYYSRPDTRGSVIGPNASAQIFPNFALCDDPSMTTQALCAEVRKNRVALELNERIDKVREEIGSDPVGACARIQQVGAEMLQLGMGRTTDVRFGSSFDQILQTYQLKKSGVDLSVGRWPWNLLQMATGGIQKDDYIIFYGRPKSGKTWVLAYLTMMLFMQDKRLVIYTKEMTAENIFMRIIAAMSEIPYAEFRHGRLSEQYERSLYEARKMVNFLQAEDKLIVLSGKDAAAGGDTVPWLHSKVKTYQPDIVVVDGLYLMSDVQRNKDDHKKVKSISNDLRQMNLETKIPVIASIQANRKAAGHNEGNLDELAFSDAVGQDATVVTRVIADREKPNTTMLVMAGSREFTLNGLRINMVPATNFSQYGVNDEDALLTSKDIEKAKTKDTGDADDPKAHATPRSNGMITNGHAQHHVEQRISQHPNSRFQARGS